MKKINCFPKFGFGLMKTKPEPPKPVLLTASIGNNPT